MSLLLELSLVGCVRHEVVLTTRSNTTPHGTSGYERTSVSDTL